MQRPDAVEVSFANGVSLALCLAAGGEVIGLGEVCVGGIALRNGAVPLYPWIRSLDGVDYARFVLRDVEARSDGAMVVRCRALGVPRHETAFGDEYKDHQFRVAQSDPIREDELAWLLRPESLDLDGLRYEGFSYAWTFASATQRIHRIVSVGSWEIGGRLEGNTVLSQGQVTPAVYRPTRDSHFTSACLKSLREFGKPLNTSFQWNHRWSPHQCFDFVAAPRGSLVGFWPERADVRSFCQKNPGEDVWFVVDAAHGTAAPEFQSPRKCILFAPAGPEGLPDHEMRNRWHAAWRHCTASVRAHFGIRPTRPRAECPLPYKTRLQSDRRLQFAVGDRWVPHEEWLIAMADDFLPVAAQRGFRRVIPDPISESDPTERGLECKLMSGIHGDLNVGSVCCTHRFRPAQFFGGMKAWRYFYDKAHALGLEAGHWIAGHLSYHAPILREHPDWALRGFDTLTFSGGYPNYEMACLNLNTGVRQWILDDLRRWKDEGGLDYVLFDSLSNLALLPLDYSQAMASNAAATAEFIAELQRSGIPGIVVEGIGPLGTGCCHAMDAGLAAGAGAQAITGQNCWEWYEGNEDMLVGQQIRPGAHPRRTDEDVRQRFFRCLANRCVISLAGYLGPTRPERLWHRLCLDAYERVESDLVDRHILSDRRGVLWRNGSAVVLFSFRDFEHRLAASAPVETVMGEPEGVTAAADRIHARAWSIYRWCADD
jgi:hypothetical protein